MSEKVLKREISAEDKQFNKNKWLFSVSGLGRDMCYQLIASFLLVYIQFGTTLSVLQFTVISLLIGVVGRIWDAINDPMMGAIIEGTHLKFGKFRPWIFIGAVLTGIIVIVMFNVQSLVGWGFVAFMAIMYLLWESAFTMNDIGYWSMLASLSSKKKQRDQATTLTVIFAGIGAFAAQGVISFLYPGHVRLAFRWISIGIAVIFIVMQVIMSLFVKERPRAQMEVNEKISLKQMWRTIRQNDQILWMTLSMLFYNVGSAMLVGLAYNLYYLEIGYDGNAIVFVAIFGIFNVLAQVFYPLIVKKLGRKKLQIVSVALACFGYLGIALIGWWNFLPFNLITLSIFGICVFIGQALFYMASIINMTNCVEYNEYKCGERNEAVISTLRPFMAKFADALKYGIVTLILTVSLVYGLSQNISTLESQTNYFNADDVTITQQVEYINAVNKFRIEWNDATEEQRKDKDFVNEFADRIENYESNSLKPLAGHQISPDYINSIGDAAIMKVENKGVKGQEKTTFVSLVKNVENANDVLVKEDNVVYRLSMTYTDEATGTEYNAANNNFKAQSDLSMRLWVRMGVTLVPIVCIVIALIIQHKKFIITEDYYDMMLVEIDKHRKENGDQPIGDDSNAVNDILPPNDASDTDMPK